MAAVESVLRILAVVAESLGRFFRRQEAKAHERKVRELQQDPARFMDQHFNGDADQSERVQRDSSVPGDAGETGKAKSAEHDGDDQRRH